MTTETHFSATPAIAFHINEGLGLMTRQQTAAIRHTTNGRSKKPKSSTNGPDSSLTYDNNVNKKVPTLIPRQRLAIPKKYLNANEKDFGRNGLVLEVEAVTPVPDNKPLVQWESDNSEEELTFFPKPKLKSTLTDNMSVENMSISGEDDDDDDLHLSPPKSKSNCPCDPRLLLENKWLNPSEQVSSLSWSSIRDRIESCVIS